jgi:hypothetical protein
MEWGQLLNIPPCSFPGRAMFLEISSGLSLEGLAPPVSVLRLTIVKFFIFYFYFSENAHLRRSA